MLIFKVPVGNTNLGIIFREMFGVIGEGSTNGKESRAREEEKQEDNLGEVSWHSDGKKAPRALLSVSLPAFLTLCLCLKELVYQVTSARWQTRKWQAPVQID